MNKEKLIEKLETSGFIKSNNYKIEEIKENKSVTIKGYLKDTSYNPYDMAHGGYIFGLGDTAMGIAASATGRQAVTLSASINYLKPSYGKYLVAKAKIIKQGKSVCYLTTNIYNDKKELVATMESNYFYVN